MAKYLIIILFSMFTLISCETINNPINNYHSSNKLVYVDVVEKKILKEDDISQSIYSKETNKSLIQWFSNDIKTNGFEGHVDIKIKDIVTNENKNDNDLLINIYAKIELTIYKSILDSKKIISLEGDEHGQLIGDFSLNDKSIEVQNIIKRLIEKFSIKLFNELN